MACTLAGSLVKNMLTLGGVENMNFAQTVKKIFALSTGATLMGTTLLGASAAADLSNYPAPFVQDGRFNTVIVIGDNAQAADNIGATDIALGLQFDSKVAVGVSGRSRGSGSSATGDTWQVGTSSNDLVLGENISDVISSIGEDDELAALNDGEIRIGGKTYEYEQRIEFGPNLRVEFDEDDDDNVGTFLKVADDGVIATYTLDFDSGAESSVDDNSFAEDFEDEEIFILGREYTIAKAELVNSDAGLRIELLSGSEFGRLNEGEERSFDFNGKNYVISLNSVTEDRNDEGEASFSVNGELTGELEDGEVYTLDDGTELGVRRVVYYDGNNPNILSSAQFYIGANSIVLEDRDISDNAFGRDLEVSEEDLTIAETRITGTISGSGSRQKVEIDTLSIEIKADDDFFVAEGETISEQFDDDDDADAFLGWDLTYAGLTSADTEDISLTVSSNDEELELGFVDADGENVKLPLAYVSGDDALSLGESSDERLVLDETIAIDIDDVFVVSDTGDQKSWAFEFKEIDDDDDEIVFRNLGNGDEETLDLDLSDSSASDQLRVGGNTFTVQRESSTSIKVSLNGDSDVTDTGLVPIYTDAGAQIDITQPSDTVVIAVNTADSDDYDGSTEPTSIIFVATESTEDGASNREIELSVGDAGIDLIGEDGDDDEDDRDVGYNSYGAYVVFDSDDNEVDIDYPVVQLLPEVFVTTPGSEIVASSSDDADAGDGSAFRVNRGCWRSCSSCK